MEHATENQSFLDEDTFRLSFDSEEEEAPTEPWYSIIRSSTTDQLQSLQTIFKEKELKVKLTKTDENVGLTKEEFVNAVDEVFGVGKYSVQATLLFDAVDKEKEFEINWKDFVNFLLKKLITTPRSKLLLGNPQISAVPHVKREAVVKIVSVETENYFCYAVVSKRGHVGVYDGNMNFLTSYHVVTTIEDVYKDYEDRRKRNRWITDALFCKDSLMLLIANTTRSISIYEASGIKHTLVWLILSLPNVIQCLWYQPSGSDGKSLLLMGDDQGRISSLTFLQAKTEMLRKKHNDKPNVFYWMELPAEKQHVRIKSIGKFHNDFVRQIQYIEENGSIITCSRDRNVSLVNKHIANRREAYTFKMNRGADCFCLSNSAKLVITGSSDGIIRFWDIVIPARPITVLSGHRAGIVDLQSFDDQEALISCSRDANLKVWDTRSYTCMQNIKLYYPVFETFGKTIEWGSTCIYPGPKRSPTESNKQNEEQLRNPSNTWKRSHILVTCCNYIAKLKLTYPDDIDVEAELEMPILQPPPLQNSVLIPSTWKIRDDNILTNESTTSVLHDKKVEERIKDLKFILEKDLMTDFYDYNEDINYRIAVIERKKQEMKENVARGAPFLALDLYEIEDVTLSADLPVPKKKSVQTLVEKTQKMLADAANRSQIFSEPSSSRSKSSRSSVVEFEY